MSTNSQRYGGYFSYKMDPKFRVSIQPGWRPANGEILRLQESKAHGMPVIKVLTQEAFDFRVKIIEDSDLSPKKKLDKMGNLYMRCREASVNEQGKLLIPKELSEKAGIAAEGEVVLAGRGLHFEIWSKANHARLLAIADEDEDEDELGIN